MKNHKIALTGASGFVGKELQNIFKNTVILHRDDTVDELSQKLKGVDTVINLAGGSIVKRWSDSYKKILYSSRIESTKKLVEAIDHSDVSYFISTSAIGIYPNDRPSDESCIIDADDFLATLCIEWETEALKCQKPTAIMRFGVVLGRDGGALSKMLLPFRLGLGGKIGDGKMITSWIAISDLLRMYQFLIENKTGGIFNAVSPNPVTNERFTKALGEALHRPTIFPLPVSVLKLIYGEASSVLTDSKEVYPHNIVTEGFEFEYMEIEEALFDMLE